MQKVITKNSLDDIDAPVTAAVTQYQRLSPVKALSFDLDDTLYNNAPVIKKAVSASFALLIEQFPKASELTLDDWQAIKIAEQLKWPELMHDTSAARYAMLREGLIQLGYSELDASQGAQNALDCFHDHRSDFKVSADVIKILAQLKQRYRLVGITNGNVNSARIGLDEVFDFVLHPGYGVKMKPYGDMFALACKQLSIQPAELLHVGDHPHSDVVGARIAGCQTIWLNPCQQQKYKSSSNLLPTVEITQLNQLLTILL
ncbi:HAD-IA family hydrolase [Shewanella gaetbuli]|uniref:HAD-IA family hydrolase n=1 Tax=Shewanella gaetbuli TaxID=220752 RepID=A0A9X2CJV9_9GAMM|nr:HAD-IA family hydrolase [Shewanella gaetbuli]MCL1141095.1 HAD-IA family hydrolase [Shewanella gaetbuli]